MEFKPYEPGIEISGDSIAAVVDAFGNYPSVVKRYLEKFGVAGSDRPLDRKAWYSQEVWLSCQAAMAAEVGGNAMFEIGKIIPGGTVPLPPMAKDIHSALATLDIGYHLNHRKFGVVMFDPSTGRMMEGIGHYYQQPVQGENKIIVTASNPYDCNFDRGIIYGLARRFQPLVKVLHDNTKPCRKLGADSCTYTVTW